ncbi:origin recognition complex subunit 2-domain-containing protein [Bisporella sp. PMI_857]|nr:origin recognition complex subunit 2-domain-containing protein [Bisporella sp. PMI_857]
MKTRPGARDSGRIELDARYGDETERLGTRRKRRTRSNSNGISTVSTHSGTTSETDGSLEEDEEDEILDSEASSGGSIGVQKKLRSREESLGKPKLKSSKAADASSLPHYSRKRTKLATTSTPATPKKDHGFADIIDTPALERHADRSARKKTTSAMVERLAMGDISDDEIDNDIIDNIYVDDDHDVIQGEPQTDGNIPEAGPVTPSKAGRPKGSKNRKRSPSPPKDLPPHELYFSQNRGGRTKTGHNTLSSMKLLDHEEYFKLTREYKNPHAYDLIFLQEEFAKSFNQWHFELSQGFGICLYGFGSKRSLLMKFAEHVYDAQTDHATNKIVVVNGYIHNVTIKDVLNTVALALAEQGVLPEKLGSQPGEMLENLIVLLEEDRSKSVTIILHSIDGPALRRPTTQTILSRLSSLPQIRLITSADHPLFPLLWDSSLRATYNFLFHECTTFQPYTSEMDVVDEVNDLFGRSGRRVGGKGGVSFVLKSLPENGRKLYRILIQEQLASLDYDSRDTFGIADDGDDDNDRPAANTTKSEAGVEARVLYQKAVEDFICSNDMNFRTLLKEFGDHQMVKSRYDALGTEILSIPFRKEELETILEDLVC